MSFTKAVRDPARGTPRRLREALLLLGEVSNNHTTNKMCVSRSSRRQLSSVCPAFIVEHLSAGTAATAAPRCSTPRVTLFAHSHAPRTMKLMLVAKSTCDLTPRRISISHVADGPRVEGRGRGRVGCTGQSAAGAVVQGAVLRGSIRRLPPGGRGGGNSDDNNRTDSTAWDQPDTAYPSQAVACLQHGTSHPLPIHKAPPSIAPSSKQLVPFTSSHPWANGSGASGRTHWPVLDTTRGSAAAWNGLFRRFAVSMLEVLGGLHLWRGRRRGMRRRRTA